MRVICPHCKFVNFFPEWGLSDFYEIHICCGCGEKIRAICKPLNLRDTFKISPGRCSPW